MRFLLGLIMFGLLAGDGQCVASIGGGCPPSWSKWGANCYKVTDKIMKWSEAKQECIGLDSVMAVPQSKDEIEHLKLSKNKFWVDCSNFEGTWVVGEGTTDGKWKEGQPTNDGNCTIAPKDFTGWNDVPCSKLFLAICKKTEAILHF